MPKSIAALLCALLLVPAFASPVRSDPSSTLALPSPFTPATKPPQIYYTVARPICSELQHHIVTAIGMLLQNDRDIAKSPPIFKQYSSDAFMNADPKSPYDSTNYNSSGRDMALERMEQLVPSLAQNVIAVQKMVQSTTLANSTGVPEDDKRLAQIRAQLLEAVALQSASLDLINGFVTTQQLGDIQHAGTEFLSEINAVDVGSTPRPADTPNTLMQDPNQPGLAPNPYAVDVTAMPGLTVGYNPISRVLGALGSIQTETSARENDLAKSVGAVAAGCGVATPAPHSP